MVGEHKIQTFEVVVVVLLLLSLSLSDVFVFTSAHSFVVFWTIGLSNYTLMLVPTSTQISTKT
jgi:hypothetical protein